MVKDPTITGLLDSGVRRPVYGETSIPSTIEAKITQELNVQSFNFKLISWQKKGEGIIFDLIITSEQDSWLYLFFERSGLRTRVFDDFGNEYNVSKIQLGNKSTAHDSTRNVLVTGVPMKAIISFDNFSPQAKNIPLFEIRCLTNDKNFSVQFRNIPISK